MQPYFQDDLVTLYQGDCLEIMQTFSEESFDCVITDPPYSDRTHSNAKSNKNKGHGNTTIDFASADSFDLTSCFELLGKLSKGWVVATIDYNHAFQFETEPPAGLTQKRIGVWMKTNPMPQISADRPSQGWEAITYLHKADKKSTWNGGGSHGNYISPLATATGHPTPKPLAMVTSFVERFTNHGDLILDPFAGGGTTLLAARNMGRKVIGIEMDEKYCELIANRLSQQAFDF
jgi:site-specific DNA-methyltransferase (adenine-specific)